MYSSFLFIVWLLPLLVSLSLSLPRTVTYRAERKTSHRHEKGKKKKVNKKGQKVVEPAREEVTEQSMDVNAHVYARKTKEKKKKEKEIY